jgi:hypothetical protein
MYPSLEEIQDVEERLRDMMFEHWLHHDVFSPQWWLLLGSMFLPWLLWWKLVDRNRLLEISVYGGFMMVVITFLDHAGAFLVLWGYDYKLIPIDPSLYALDFSTIAVAHMLIYQYYRTWKSFLWANAIMGFLFSFILEPITVWMGIYKMYKWEYAYSWPIYIAKAALLKFMVGGLIKRDTGRQKS